MFYAWGEIEYVLLLILSCLANYVIGLLIETYRERWGRVFLTTGIVINIFVLGVFKYLTFIIHSMNSVLAFLKIPLIEEIIVHLPLGISFFTFQAISYLIDVYRKKALVEKNPINVALYISMFPQLVAGPIVRFSTITRQISSRTITCRKFAEGVKFFIIGFGQKMLIANSVAKAVDEIFQIPSPALDASLSWVAALCYSIQIYFDFSGYSHMAIGLGLMMGFNLPENFNYPYISQSITEFWRRWHITLSTWFRDYLYIPLGGNKKGKHRTYINLVIVFFLCGLWHGASWTFAVWGLYHGFFMVLERLGFKKFLVRMPRVLGHIYCLGTVTIGWVLFRAETFDRAIQHLKAMIGFGTGDGSLYPLLKYLQPDVMIALFVGILCSTPFIAEISGLMDDYTSKNLPILYRVRIMMSKPVHLLILIFIFTAAVMGLSAGVYNPFIYFRF
jgi:alginate O-acetyltransferase complex protein AlgI